MYTKYGFCLYKPITLDEQPETQNPFLIGYILRSPDMVCSTQPTCLIIKACITAQSHTYTLLGYCNWQTGFIH